VTPENVTVEFFMRKAVPFVCPSRRLQSKTVTSGTPTYDRAKCKKLVGEAKQLRDKGQTEQAKAKFQEAIAADPTFDWSYISLARMYAAEKDLDKATEVLNSAIIAGASTADLHLEYHENQCHLEHWDVALIHANKSAELDPNNFRAFNAIAHCKHIGFKKPEEAIPLYQRALSCNPESAFALGRLGKIANNRGDLDQAKRYLEKACAAAAAMGSTYVGANWKSLLDEVNQKIRKRDQWETLPTIPEMVQYLDRYVCGQERAKQELATSIYNHFISLSYQDDDVRNPDLGRYNILIFGPSGCGKTYMIELLTKKLGVPLCVISATSLGQT
jgi:tetratricopeptide (TPR) repeat protein